MGVPVRRNQIPSQAIDALRDRPRPPTDPPIFLSSRASRTKRLAPEITDRDSTLATSDTTVHACSVILFFEALTASFFLGSFTSLLSFHLRPRCL
ncbi:hypothetical protein N7510_010263 [Penicillium lagena]|uniref:uncharacterized protein n=1 Tax=Penicillium lagena TaxID=94218 RepID=UPI002541C1A9|nr:uncharacterized protein N7510_010263 [Penicillium lagena]KAJ5605109.1 hypothetical protein N7510_010263 [Penicillium lagena]